ncbi:MAG: cytochrome c family protein [Planctomycetota bacterium]
MPKRMRVVLAAFVVLVSVVAWPGFVRSQDGEKKPEPKYIGIKKCKLCHSRKSIGAHYKVWEKGPHANAFEVLKSDKAKAVAKEQGLSTPPHEAKECLPCHVPGYGLDKKRYDKDYDPTQGVTCEACHGPAELYWEEEKHAGDAAQAAEKLGLVHPTEKTCLGCHNEKSPTYKPFDFEERWKKIAHMTPEK